MAGRERIQATHCTCKGLTPFRIEARHGTLAQPWGHDEGCPWRCTCPRQPEGTDYAHPEPCPWYDVPETREEALRSSLARLQSRRNDGLGLLMVELIVRQDRTNELLERLLADVDE